MIKGLNTYMNTLLSDFIEKEYRTSVVSLLVFYYTVFGLPDFTSNINCIIILGFALFCYILLQGLSKNEQIREYIFSKYLVNLEISFRENRLEHEYYELNEDNKKEIDKIDKYIDILLSKYILSMSWIFLFSLQFLLYKSRILQLNSLNLQFFIIPGYSIIIFAIVVNLVNILNFKNEFLQYAANYEKVYTIFRSDKERAK